MSVFGLAVFCAGVSLARTSLSEVVVAIGSFPVETASLDVFAIIGHTLVHIVIPIALFLGGGLCVAVGFMNLGTGIYILGGWRLLYWLVIMTSKRRESSPSDPQY